MAMVEEKIRNNNICSKKNQMNLSGNLWTKRNKIKWIKHPIKNRISSKKTNPYLDSIIPKSIYTFPTKLLNTALATILIPKANPTEPVRLGAPDFPDVAGDGASKSDGLSPSSGDPVIGDSPFNLLASGGDASVSAVGRIGDGGVGG